jgi:transcription factor IIIB 90 kDa subunit
MRLRASRILFSRSSPPPTLRNDGEGGTRESDAGTAVVTKKPRAPLPAGADLSKAPAISFRRDEDGFIVPLLPKQIAEIAEATQKDDTDPTTSLEGLVEAYGDEAEEDQEDSTNQQGSGTGRGRRAGPQLPINEEWEEDERRLEEEMGEIFNDPLTIQHAMAYSNAEQRARIHSHWALQQQPQKDVSMAAEINEDEFADDPEVINCLLSPEETKIKETIWVNQNKDWLRSHQEKVFQRKLDADKPKSTRRRRKRPRMGEGQTSPASSAAEAAINVAKDRAWSKRINYDAIRSMFDMPNIGGPGSEATSRKTSMAGSALGTREEQNEAPDESVAGEEFEEEEEYDEEGNYRGGNEGETGEFEGGYDDDDPDMGLDDDGYDEQYA